VTTWAVSTFNNELDVLEIRLETLDPIVDRFVLTEMVVTQNNKPKPLHFEENKERFAKWLPKITHVIVEDPPEGVGYDADWRREHFQRNASSRALYPDLEDTDVVLVTDLDEIPYPEAVLGSIESLRPEGTRFLMDMILYTLRWRWLDRACQIGSTATINYGLAFRGREIHDVLYAPYVSPTFYPGVAGWHLSYQGGLADIRNKMTCIADNFYDQLVPEEKKGDPNVFLTDGWIQESIDTGRDIYGRDYRPSEWIPITELPPCVQANPDKYAHMLTPWEAPEHPIGIRCTCGAYYDADKNLCHFPKCELYDSL
jgi:beta-1,4-mannosyl-glycoprotein beta-1,4-N-acetylglucosaminyltransferase